MKVPGHLDRALDRLGARAHEERPGHARRSTQPIRELLSDRDRVLARVDEGQRAKLLAHALDDARVRMTDRDDRRTAARVQNRRTILEVKIVARAPDHSAWQALQVAMKDRRGRADRFSSHWTASDVTSEIRRFAPDAQRASAAPFRRGRLCSRQKSTRGLLTSDEQARGREFA